MAAPGSAVSILAPNGRRVTVKVSAGTALLQVLEEICRKQNFNPDDYDLKFQRTVLDLSLQWRFANLPNNAKLEMVPTSRLRAGTTNKVRIALQLEDGSRLQDEFLSSQTLWELLHHFAQSRACVEALCRESSPVCIYMRNEVSGEAALKTTSLKSLGLTGGSGKIRFFIKRASVGRSDSQGLQAATSTHSAQGEPGRLQPVTSTPSADCDSRRPQPSTPSAQGDPGCPLPTTSNSAAQTFTAEHHSITSGPSTQQEPPPVARSPHVEERVEIIAGDGDALPATESCAVLSLDSLPLQREVHHWFPSKATAPTVNTELHTKDKLPSKEEIQPCSLQEARHTMGTPNFVPFLGGGQRLGGSAEEGSMEVNLPTYHSSPGGPSKPKKSKTLAAQEGGSLPLDREALISHLDLEDPVRQEWLASCPDELPDNFFDITVDDVRKRLAQLKSERQRLTEMPLMTNALREAQKKEKLERYPKVVLRVLFPDRYVLQGFFHPEETVGALREFVKSHLEDGTVPFYLFLTPPKTLLKDESETLFQADLFPAAVVHFGTEVGKDHHLRQQLLDTIVPPSLADLLVARSMPRPLVTTPPSLPEASTSEEVPSKVVNDDSEDAAITQAPHTVKSDPAKVPKWLKLPGKK
ncbi:tether containing UBX domain for GLUT4 [Ambystoma mexicanum]|uniref:tether containing UBX domain for GLUT4 n=1 Tax=Ambystoma mexicanum TaxID=8296 RepID=UPI0037E8A3B4